MRSRQFDCQDIQCGAWCGQSPGTPAACFTKPDRELRLTQTGLLPLVEDDQRILKMLTETLEESGFTINVAATAEQAIEILDAEGTNFCALITDVNLPGVLNGWE